MSQAKRSRISRFGPVIAVGAVSVAVVVALAVLPVSTWMSQRRATNETQTELTRAEGEVAELQAQLDLLETDAEVERMARENFDLVFPGEESYRILPAPGSSD